MAVDKFSGIPDASAGLISSPLLEGRILLEETLARFDEQVAANSPTEIRRRLRKKLSNVRVNINGDIEA
jgi:hypothetical protein